MAKKRSPQTAAKRAREQAMREKRERKPGQEAGPPRRNGTGAPRGRAGRAGRADRTRSAVAARGPHGRAGGATARASREAWSSARPLVREALRQVRCGGLPGQADEERLPVEREVAPRIACAQWRCAARRRGARSRRLPLPPAERGDEDAVGDDVDLAFGDDVDAGRRRRPARSRRRPPERSRARARAPATRAWAAAAARTSGASGGARSRRRAPSRAGRCPAGAAPPRARPAAGRARRR